MAEPRYQQQTPIVDTRYTPSASILQFVEGSTWNVNYYSQVLGADSEAGPQQVDAAPVYQQYCLIEGAELKVTEPLAPVQDPVSKSFDTGGGATTFPRFIPNKGDMFLADIGDGRMGVFTVTSTEKKTYLKDALYHIEYKLLDYADSTTGTPRVADLETKTIKRAIYRKDFLQFGQNPVVLSQDFDYLISFESSYGELLSVYMHDFFSREFSTLILPDQTEPCYDPFLTKALLTWVSTDEHPWISRIKQPRVSDDKAMDQLTLWDCLARLDKNLLPSTMYQIGLLDTSYWRGMPHLSGIFFTGISKVVYPRDKRTDVDAAREAQVTDPGSNLQPGQRRFSDLQRLMDQPLDGFSYTPASGESLPDIVRVTVDDYYVFSESFYRPLMPFKSNMEKLFADALAQKDIDKEVLARLVKHAPHWDNLERFYYIPALLALLKVVLRTN